MSLDVRELLFDYENNSIKNVFHKIDNLNNFFGKKIYLYNADSVNPLQKFWIYVNRCKIINYSYPKLTIVLALTKTTDKLINFMDNITNKIQYIINNIDGSNVPVNKLDHSSSYAPTIDLIVTQETIVFKQCDQQNINCINTIKDCGLFIELDYVQLMNNVAMPSWRVLQIKELTTMAKNASFFDMMDTPKYNNIYIADPRLNTISSQNIVIPPSHPIMPFRVTIPSLHYTSLGERNNVEDFTTGQNKLPSQQKGDSALNSLRTGVSAPVRLGLSNDILAGALKKLKKPDKIPITLLEENNNLNITKSDLKKVISNVSRSMVDIMRDEHKCICINELVKYIKELHENNKIMYKQYKKQHKKNMKILIDLNDF